MASIFTREHVHTNVVVPYTRNQNIFFNFILKKMFKAISRIKISCNYVGLKFVMFQDQNKDLLGFPPCLEQFKSLKVKSISVTLGA